MRLAPSLQTVGLSKAFGGPRVLCDVDLTVNAGEIHAMLGENGSGKSTLIKIVSGYHRPEPGGHVNVGGAALGFGNPAESHARGARFVHQDLALVGDCSIADNLAFGSGFPTRAATIRRRELLAMARQDLAAVGLQDLDPTQPVRTLPLALRTGVAVARALRADPNAPAHLLVLDEPTATLPDDEMRTLHDVVRAVAGQSVGVLYVTHRLEEVPILADVVTILRDGRRVTTMPAGLTTPTELIGLMLGDARAVVEGVTAATAHGRPEDRGEAVLRLRGLSAGPLTSFDLDVCDGEIVGVAGLTGSGRESVAPAVFGAIGRHAGTVALGAATLPALRPDLSMRAGMAYVPADRAAAGALSTLSARENLTLADLRPFWKAPGLRRGREAVETRRWFDDLDVRPREGMERPLASFSGGNQQKVVLARGLRTRPRVLVLDEPTQGVDVGAKAHMHARIVSAAAEGCAVLVASSDTEELVVLCHRVVVVREGRVSCGLRGDALCASAINHEAMAS